MIYKNYGKLVADFVMAIIVAVLVLPIILAGYVAVKLSSPGSGFFIQERLGYKGRRFNVYKLRTMHENKSRRPIQTTNVDSDVFCVGKVLRRLKLDELPQVFNILKGDMSFVGPRPGLPSMLNEMPDWAKARLDVRPGLTGWAQVNGNISLSWEERWKYDVQYVNQVSLAHDFFILVRTALVVVLGEGFFRRTP